MAQDEGTDGTFCAESNEVGEGIGRPEAKHQAPFAQEAPRGDAYGVGHEAVGGAKLKSEEHSGAEQQGRHDGGHAPLSIEQRGEGEGAEGAERGDKGHTLDAPQPFEHGQFAPAQRGEGDKWG